MNSPILCTPLDGPLGTVASAYRAGSGLMAISDAGLIGSPTPAAPVRLSVVAADRSAIIGRFKVTGLVGSSASVTPDGTDADIPAGSLLRVLVDRRMIGDIHGAIGQVVAAINGISLIGGVPGPVGPKGDTGAIGPAGPQGFQGNTGSPGPIGATGPKGDTGPQGVPGVQGPPGVAGVKGDPGLVGPQGPAGANGTAGTATPAGPDNAIQFNNAGTLGGSAGLSYDGSSLTIGQGVSLSTRNAYGLDFLDFTGQHSGQGVAVNFNPAGTPSGYSYVFQFTAASSLLLVGDNGVEKHIVAADNSGGSSFPLVFRSQFGSGWNVAYDAYTLSPTGATHTFTTDQGSRALIVARAASGQSADLIQFQDSSGNVLSGVSGQGYMRSRVGNGPPTDAPPDGSFYVDNANAVLYVRVQGAWRKVALS